MTRGQRRALDSICDTFVPGASDAGVPDALLELTPAVDRRALLALLSVWDTGRRFSRRSQARREAVLRAWRDSRSAARRRVYNGLRRGTLIPFHAQDGAPRRLPSSPPRIRPTRLDGETSCDVCVIGSGAGGGVAAGVLAAAGLDVVVLEAGEHYEDGDFGGAELDAYRRMYLDAAAATTVDGGIGLLAGACVGGGTVVNYTTSFPTPDEIRQAWGEPFTSSEYTASMRAVQERLGVNTDEVKPSSRDALMAQGLARLGWHVDAMPRNTRGCEQGVVCGRCGFGCPIGAKQSTLVTWLADAQANDARIVPSTRALRIIPGSGVETRGAFVRARAVVVAAGALHTPVLLKRSGLRNPNIGRHLHLHPATAVLGFFDEEVRPWEGTLQARYSDQFANLNDGYGLKYETAPMHAGLYAAFAPWDSARESRELVAELPHASLVGVLLRDRSEGEVRPSRDGSPRVHYRLGEFDVAHVRSGIDGAAQILEAAGAKRIFSSHTRYVGYVPGDGARERFMRDADAVGYRAGRCTFYSFHLMGSARIGSSPQTSATKPTGETWDADGVYVMDGSSFPSASGVNPMLTIEAIAHLNASQLAAKLV